MTPVRPELVRYLERAWPGARLTLLPADASTRRFHRLVDATGISRIVMDYGRPFEGETDDVRLNRIFREAGLRVAAIQDVSADAGCLVLEDLGDRSLESALNDARERGRSLLERAVLFAADIALRGSVALAGSERNAGPVLDRERFRSEMDFFIQHYAGSLRRVTGASPGLRSALYDLADLAAETPRRVLCHRDFHSRNLMVLADGSLAAVDIQDGRWGPDTYDLASLLRDAYVEFDPSWIESLIRVYRERLGAPPPTPEFSRRLDLVSAQRMLKALGTFGYQVAVRGHERYLEAVPRTLERLRQLLPDREETRALGEELAVTGLLGGPASDRQARL